MGIADAEENDRTERLAGALAGVADGRPMVDVITTLAHVDQFVMTIGALPAVGFTPVEIHLLQHCGDYFRRR